MKTVCIVFSSCLEFLKDASSCRFLFLCLILEMPGVKEFMWKYVQEKCVMFDLFV